MPSLSLDEHPPPPGHVLAFAFLDSFFPDKTSLFDIGGHWFVCSHMSGIRVRNTPPFQLQA